MTERSSAADAAPLRLAVIDTDSGFLQVLTKRLERLSWEHRVLASAVPVDTVVAMRLNAIVVDLAVLGPQAWEYLEKLCAALPGLGVHRLHRPVDGGPARPRPAPRGRRLADQAVSPRGAHRAHRGRRAPAPARPGALVGRADRGRRDRDPLRSLPGLRARQLDRPHAPRVRAHRAARRRRGARARARGDLPARVGLRDGARRSLGRRLRAQAAPEAREGRRRAGATSTRTSGSATASRRSPRSARAPRPSRSSPALAGEGALGRRRGRAGRGRARVQLP